MLICCAMNVFIGLHSNILDAILDLDFPLFSILVVYTVYKDEIIYDKSLSICSCDSVVKRCSLFSSLITTCANGDLLNLLFWSICSIQHLYVCVGMHNASSLYKIIVLIVVGIYTYVCAVHSAVCRVSCNIICAVLFCFTVGFYFVPNLLVL